VEPAFLGDVARRGAGEERFDLVHATAFPYSGPLVCARRLADRLGVPFVLTPFVHLGDLDDPADRTRRAYLAPHFVDLARSADRVFVQTEGERLALSSAASPGAADSSGMAWTWPTAAAAIGAGHARNGNARQMTRSSGTWPISAARKARSISWRRPIGPGRMARPSP